MDMRLRDRVALVTGGSRGIGRATALGLAAEGCHVAIAARGQAELDTAAGLLRATGVRVLAIAADMMDPQTPGRLVAEVTAAFGRLDVVVANAGGTLGSREFATSTREDWARTFDLNVLHAIDLLREAVPALSASDAASVIVIASISGRAPTTSAASYAAAKAALIHAARSLAWELGPRGIRVNALSPGSTLFDGGGWDRTRAQSPEAFAAFEAMDFPRRRLGTLQEIADAAVFLASPRAMGINAADVQVDGGQRRPSIR
ncbi:MAG: SDR family NAD(P)-dependent oxidoreductase [Janthinobacterium lividum]